MIDKDNILSIIIPSFQQGNYLEQALLSISNQIFVDYEILVIDACSLDNTASVINKFNNLPINFIQAHDEGVYDAMNNGVKMAKGRWLYFMGCDDKLYDANSLANVAQYLAGDEFDILYGDVIFSSDNSRYAGEFDLNRLLYSENICHQSIFYRKSVFEKIGYYNLSYKIWADWDFNIRCFKHTNLRIKYLNSVIALYNNESGISSTHDKVFIQELPLFYVQQINSLKAQNAGLLSSTSFVVGNKLVNMYNSVKGFFRKYI